jgi:hypothetical protein
MIYPFKVSEERTKSLAKRTITTKRELYFGAIIIGTLFLILIFITALFIIDVPIEQNSYIIDNLKDQVIKPLNG